MDYSDEITKLRSLSDSVDQYISNGSYLLDYTTTDSITDELLLKNCYSIIIDELHSMGVILLVDTNEIFSEYSNLEGLFALRKLLDKDHLKEIFSINSECKTAFKMLFETDNLEEAYVSEFLDLYKSIFPGNKELESISKIELYISSTYRFKQHICTIIEMSYTKSLLGDDNIFLIVEYLKKIQLGREYFEKAIKSILKKYSNLNTEYLEQAIDHYDLEKVSGENLNRFCWAVMTDTNSLSDELKSLQKTILDTHHKSTTHHIEYYITNRQHPTDENVAELVAHHFEPGSTLQDFNTEISKMLKIIENASDLDIFPIGTKATLLQFTTAIVPLYNDIQQ